MDRYCSSTFWDPSKTWNTVDPDFTDCFEKTVLLWSACAFLWVTAIFDIYMLGDPDRGASALGHIPPTWRPGWTFQTVSKLLDITLLICLEIGVLCVNWYHHSEEDVNIFAIPDVLWTTPIVLICTHLLSAALIVLHKSHCVHTSGIQLIHWSLLSLVHAVILRTEVKNYHNPSTTPSISGIALLLLAISVALMFIQAFNFCWSDIPETRDGGRTRLIECSDGVQREECPMIRSSCLSYILFSWATPFVRKGYMQPLTAHDLWDLLPSLTAPVVFKLFMKSYGKRVFGQSRSIFRNIIKPLWNTCGFSFTVALSCKMVGTLMAFLSPKVMGFLIDYVEDKKIETWKGYMWAVALLIIYVMITLFWEMFYLHIFKCYVNVLTCLNLLIYTKSMRVSSEARKDKTSGEICNLMSVDVEAIRGVIYQADAIWSSPVQVIVGIVLLWEELEYAVLPGLGVILAMIPLNWILSVKISKYQRAQMKKKDERIKVISEALSGIQVVKLYAWEQYFLEKIFEVRGEEIAILRKRAFCHCVMQFVLDSVPFMVSMASFFSYVYMSGGILHPKKAFTALTLFTLLTDPIQEFPEAISLLVDARVSFKRVNDFLNAEENHPDAAKFLKKSEDEPAVEILDGTFAWEEIHRCSWKLVDINLEVMPGTLTAIVGSVAYGKSSLLSAILGDMKFSGQVFIRGKVAYVPQVAFILNASLKDNILFGMPYNKKKYDEILECCCLTADIEMLPAGDMTEIGEKGINLSGGQKQRVSLARAAYSDADVILLDDVLSAVDAHVGKHIFNKLLGPSGFLRKKTRIFCTHAYQYLSQVDHIVVMSDGRVVEEGTYNVLMQCSGSFANLMSSYIQSQEVDLKTKTRNQGTSTSSTETKSVMKETDESRIQDGKLIEDERIATGDVKSAIYAAYKNALGCPMVITIVFFFGWSEGLSLGRNVVLTKWTTASSARNITTDQTTTYALEYGCLGILQSLFYLFGYFLLAIATLRATKILHNRMLHRILHAPMSFFNVTLLGRITNRFSSDVESVDKQLPSELGDWICHIYKFVGIIIAIIFATNVYFLAFMVPLSVLYYFLQRYYILCMQQLQRLLNALRSPIYAQFQETLNGTSTIRAYKAEERFIKLLGDKIDNFNRANFPHLIVRRWLSIRLGFLGSTVVFMPALFAVLWRDTMNPSMVGLSISYAVQVTGIISWLIKVTSYLQYNFVSVERIVEYSEVEQEADFQAGRVDCPSNWPEKGKIVFDGYETRYRAGLDLVLKQFSCRIAPGEKIGIVGRTGAGKSSLTLAIFRIVEAAKGEIRIDGVNIADLGLHQVRKRLTVIPQDPVLFSRSLRLNLDPFEEYGDDKIWESLELAHLKSYVEGQENGLDFLVAEGGENLSLGQRQLVCLARAILRKSSILILDEATASVDSVTDDLIQKTIREQFGDCTILNVAHRLNTVMDSTRIMVLDHGEIVEFDTPENLLADPDSHFYGMARDAGIV